MCMWGVPTGVGALGVGVPCVCMLWVGVLWVGGCPGCGSALGGGCPGWGRPGWDMVLSLSCSGVPRVAATPWRSWPLWGQYTGTGPPGAPPVRAPAPVEGVWSPGGGSATTPGTTRRGRCSPGQGGWPTPRFLVGGQWVLLTVSWAFSDLPLGGVRAQVLISRLKCATPR